MFKYSSFHRLFSVVGDSKVEAGDFPAMLVCGFVNAICHHASHSAFGDMLFVFALS